MFIKYKRIFLFIFITLLLSSCATPPEKISKKDRQKHAATTLDTLQTSAKEVKSIDLRQAISLAIENNLEYKVNKLQAALAYKQYDLAKLDMAPKIDTSFAYNKRNKDYIKNLANAPAGPAQSLIPHTQEIGTMLFNWNVLDFGLSYVRAKQAGDRYMVAQEERKKIAMQLINNVVKNYTLAYYGQVMNKQMAEVEKEVDKFLKVADVALDQGIDDRNKLLDYKKSLLEAYRESRNYITYFNESRDKLMSLISYNSEDTSDAPQIELLPPEAYLTKLPVINSKLADLDMVALFNRPELTQAIYKTNEVSRQKWVELLQRLPSFGFNFGYNYDSDKNLKYQNWFSENMTIAWNLLQLASIQPSLDTAETQLEAQELTYLASSAVILGEIRVLLYNYKSKKYDYDLAARQSKYDDEIYKQSLNLVSSGMSDQQTLVKDKISAINSEMMKLRTFIEARNLLEDVILSLGLYHTPGELVMDEFVNPTIIAKWMDNFTSTSFDKIIAGEQQVISKIKLQDDEDTVETSNNEMSESYEQEHVAS